MKRTFTILALIITAVLLVIGYRKFFYSFDQLEDGIPYKEAVISPDGKYTAESFYETYGGAAGGAHVWVEVTNNETDESSVIYFSDGKSTFGMKWKDSDTLLIKNNNGPKEPRADRSIALDVGSEIYDAYGRACSSWLMKDTYQACYQHH